MSTGPLPNTARRRPVPSASPSGQPTRPVAVLVTGDAQQDRAAMIATNIAPAERSAARPPYGERARATQERGRSQQVLADGFAAASSDVDFDLRTRVRAVATEAERVVEETDPARDWATVDARLRAQLAHEGEHTCALLAARVTEIAAALATEVGGGLLRPFSAPAAPDLDADLPTHDAPTGTRLPLAVRWRTLVMSRRRRGAGHHRVHGRRSPQRRTQASAGPPPRSREGARAPHHRRLPARHGQVHPRHAPPGSAASARRIRGSGSWSPRRRTGHPIRSDHQIGALPDATRRETRPTDDQDSAGAAPRVIPVDHAQVGF
jgi:hypothetical protein